MPPHILLVDDDEPGLMGLAETIRLRWDGDIVVDSCQSVAAALNLVRVSEYDVIISDVKMPGPDGLDLMRESEVVQPATPVLLITGYSEQALMNRATQLGAYDVIEKPINRDSFMLVLRRAIETRQLRRQIEEHLDYICHTLEAYDTTAGPAMDDIGPRSEGREEKIDRMLRLLQRAFGLGHLNPDTLRRVKGAEKKLSGRRTRRPHRPERP